MSPERPYLASLIAATAATQLFLAHRFYGFLTGDDVEVHAEAFRVALGFDYRAWVIRNLLIPDFIAAPPVWLASRLGIRDSHGLILAATLPFIAAFGATIVLVHRIALRWTNDPLVARIAALLFATHWIPLGYGSTVYPRTIATLCLVAATLLVMNGRPWLAGALVGVAFADRFSEIVFLVALMLLAGRNAWRVAVAAAISIAITAGVYDWVTWGAPFASAIRFAKLTLVAPDFASRVKYQPVFWYLTALPRWLPFTLLPLLWFARWERAWSFVVLPLVVLSLIAHKELRYLHGVIPFVAILAAAGFVRMPRRYAYALLILSIAWQLAGVGFLARKTNPAVDAARFLAADPRVHVVAMSQLWAYGDRLYFTDEREVIDVGTPPRELDRVLPHADAICLYESDLDDATYAQLARARFTETRTFRAEKARDVVVFRRISE